MINMIRFLSLITLINTVSQSWSDISGRLVTGESFRVSGLDQDDLLRDPRSWRGSNRVNQPKQRRKREAAAVVIMCSGLHHQLEEQFISCEYCPSNQLIHVLATLHKKGSWRIIFIITDRVNLRGGISLQQKEKGYRSTTITTSNTDVLSSVGNK